MFKGGDGLSRASLLRLSKVNSAEKFESREIVDFVTRSRLPIWTRLVR